MKTQSKINHEINLNLLIDTINKAEIPFTNSDGLTFVVSNGIQVTMAALEYPGAEEHPSYNRDAVVSALNALKSRTDILDRVFYADSIENTLRALAELDVWLETRGVYINTQHSNPIFNFYLNLKYRFLELLGL